MSTLTRADLADTVHKEVGLSRTESAELVDQVIESICYALEKGEDVKLSGFATFSLREKGERIGRNPKTGEEVPITPRRVLSFKASTVLKNKITSSRKKAEKAAKRRAV